VYCDETISNTDYDPMTRDVERVDVSWSSHVAGSWI
jgi:hypothetical protein